MIFDPPILALLTASAISMLALGWAALFAVRVLLRWDPASGHAEQIAMERRTHLVSTVVRLVVLAQLAALVLFVHNADRMAVLFTGAMCALGTINVNSWGMPAFLTQVGVFFLAVLWLVIDAADQAERDYPWTRLKHALLLLLAPAIIAAGVFQWLYFLNLDPNVITSCCSKLFTPEGAGVQADLAAADPRASLVALFGGLGLLGALAAWALRARAGAAIFGLAGAGFFVVAIVAIISVVSPYIYEAPTHHCPFCILKPQYGFIGYALYLPLFFASGLSLGAAALALWPGPARGRASLRRRLRRLVLAATGLFMLFGAVALAAILRSHLVLFG